MYLSSWKYLNLKYKPSIYGWFNKLILSIKIFYKYIYTVFMLVEPKGVFPLGMFLPSWKYLNLKYKPWE